MHLNEIFLVDWKISKDWSTFARLYDVDMTFATGIPTGLVCIVRQFESRI